MADMGRPRIEIDWAHFEIACKLMATKEEICGLLNVSDATLQRRIKEQYDDTFEGVLKRLSGEAKVSLRRCQFRNALDGNTTMQIWLGKQYLGQADKQEVTGKYEGDLKITDKFREHTDNIIRRLNIPMP